MPDDKGSDADDAPQLPKLAAMLDYLINEGERLDHPSFVYLLEMAKLDLLNRDGESQ
jgi:hypothetical protein